MTIRFATLATQLLLAGMLGELAGAAAAHGLTVRECQEGGDFIKNAAMSRDNGITRQVFLDRLESDLLMVRQYPPHMRWFAQDEDDETLLVQAVRTVFDAPRDPASHQSEFLARCAATNQAGSGTSWRALLAAAYPAAP